MGERLLSHAAAHPGRTLAALAAVAVLGGALAAGGTGDLALSMTESKGAPLQIRASGGLPARSPPFRVAVRTMRSQLGADPAVAAVRERRAGRRASVLMVRFAVGGGRRDAAIERIERNLDPGLLAITFGGPVGEVRAARDAVIEDLWLLLAALPLAALLAAATLGARPGAAALIAGAAAAALACLAGELLARIVDVPWPALAAAAGSGVLVALQLSAMRRCGAAARSVWCAAAAAAAVFGAGALLGVGYLAMAGLGGALAAILAAPASLVAMAAADGLDRERPVGGVGFWRGLGDALGWSRAVAALVALLGLALLAFGVVPLERLSLSAIGNPRAPDIGVAELAAAAVAATLLAAFLAAVAGGAPGLALAGGAACALAVAAVAGLAVAALQEGGLAEPLDYGESGSLRLGSLAGALSVVAALAAAQLVALVAARRAGSSGAEAVEEAMGRTGPPATLSCLTGVAAGAALGFASEPFVKEFGLAVAVGLLLQLLIVQALVYPALLRFAPVRNGPQ